MHLCPRVRSDRFISSGAQAQVHPTRGIGEERKGRLRPFTDERSYLNAAGSEVQLDSQLFVARSVPVMFQKSGVVPVGPEL